MNNISRKDRIVGALFALFGGVLWGMSGCIGEFLFTRKAVSSLWLVPYRLLAAGIILLIYCTAKFGIKYAARPFTIPLHRKELLVYGIFGITLSQLAYFMTIQLSTAGVATILQDLSPVFILICVCIAGKRYPSLSEISAIVLALFGVTLLVTHGSLEEFAVSPSALIMGIITAIGVVVYNLYPKNILKEYNVLLLQAWSFLIGGTILCLIFRPWLRTPAVIDMQVILGFVGVVILGNIMAFNIYMLGVRRIGAQKAVLYGFTEPVSAALISSLLLGADFTVWDGVGFVCVFVMLVLLSLRKD